MLNLPELTQYYSASFDDAYNKLCSVRTCNLVVGCLAYNEGCSVSSPNYKPTEWTLLNRVCGVSENNYILCAVANMCGQQNKELFPGGSFIYQTYIDSSDSFKRVLFAGGQQKENNFSLFMGPEFTDKVFAFNLNKDFDI